MIRRLATASMIAFGFSGATQAAEISLYNSSREAVAYIDNDITIYTWDGQPVAYLESPARNASVYGFNGRHLGWLSNGLVIDHNGNVACATRSAIGAITAETAKSTKSAQSAKSAREATPAEPAMTQLVVFRGPQAPSQARIMRSRGTGQLLSVPRPPDMTRIVSYVHRYKRPPRTMTPYSP
jgi:hypothetical protein